MVTWERFGELARELPEVTEREGTMSAFLVGGKRFAGPSRHEGAVWTRCDPDERPLIVASNPDRYRLTPHFEGAPGFLLIWLEHADEQDLRERLLDAWLLQAPKRLAAKHGLGPGSS